LPIPTGISVFPRDMFRPSRRWCERRFGDLRFFERLDRGGHFAALEQPELFVDQVRRLAHHPLTRPASAASASGPRAAEVLGSPAVRCHLPAEPLL
jgi:hypothetical protein